MTSISDIDTLEDHAQRDHLAIQISHLLVLPERVEELHHELRRSIASQADAIETLPASLGQLLQLTRALADKQTLLEEASKRQALLSEQHYQRHVLEPLTRHVMQLSDLTEQALFGRIDASSLVQVVQGVHEQLLELLAAYGCEPIESSEGATFDPAVMRPVETRPTTSKSKNKKVAASLQRGFRQDRRVLRPESVALYDYQVTNHEVERSAS